VKLQYGFTASAGRFKKRKPLLGGGMGFTASARAIEKEKGAPRRVYAYDLDQGIFRGLLRRVDTEHIRDMTGRCIGQSHLLGKQSSDIS